MGNQQDEALPRSQAPLHQEPPGEQMSSHPEIKGEIARKNDKMLSLLKDVDVDCKDPVSSVQVKDAGKRQKPKEFRLPEDHHSDMMNVKNTPKGKISIVEALTLLNNHKLYPDTWTAEKIARCKFSS